MKNLILAMLLLVAPFAASADGGLFDNHDWWTGASVGADINGDYAAVTITRGLFSKSTNLDVGIQGYAELGGYNYDEGSGVSATIGIEPVLTWKNFYVGLGLSLGNTTPNLGTVWNFSSVGGYRYKINDSWSVDAALRHRSHAARAGIEKDKANGGVTIVNLQAVFTF